MLAVWGYSVLFGAVEYSAAQCSCVQFNEVRTKRCVFQETSNENVLWIYDAGFVLLHVAVYSVGYAARRSVASGVLHVVLHCSMCCTLLCFIIIIIVIIIIIKISNAS